MRQIRQNGATLVIEYRYVCFREKRIQKKTGIPDPPHDPAELHVLACSSRRYGHAC